MKIGRKKVERIIRGIIRENKAKLRASGSFHRGRDSQARVMVVRRGIVGGTITSKGGFRRSLESSSPGFCNYAARKPLPPLLGRESGLDERVPPIIGIRTSPIPKPSIRRSNVNGNRKHPKSCAQGSQYYPECGLSGGSRARNAFLASRSNTKEYCQPG